MGKVINFHDVRDIEWFSWILGFLKNEYQMVSINQLEDIIYQKQSAKDICHITIDDGDKTFYDIIYPALIKHGIPATIFVSPQACINSRNFWFQEMIDYEDDNVRKVIVELFGLNMKLLNQYSIFSILKTFQVDDIWRIIDRYRVMFNAKSKELQIINVNQLFEIENSGLVTIGAHTLTHPVLANETDERSGREIEGSIHGLEEILGHKVKYFAYPNGIPDLDFSKREMKFLMQSGIRLAFNTRSMSFSPGDNPLSIPRIGFSYGNELFVRAKLMLGQNWEKVRSFKKKSEEKERMELILMK